MRAIWSGGISFGLIFIPVNLYTAHQREDLEFHYYRKSDMSPIHYKKVSEKDDKEVMQDDIVRAHEYEEGKFVALENDDFEKANVQKAKTIEILAFVDEKEIDPKYFEKPYYLAPEGEASKTYQLLLKTLEETGKVGVARFVLRNREHLAVLRPAEDVLQLNQLYFADEILDPQKADLKIPDEKISDDELKLAKQIVDQMSQKFDISKYKDSYTAELKHMIKEKVVRKKVSTKGKEPTPTQAVDIMQKLKESLASN